MPITSHEQHSRRATCFYCLQPHGSRHQGRAVLIGSLVEGSEALMVCPDPLCRARYACGVSLPDGQGDIFIRQIQLKRR